MQVASNSSQNVELMLQESCTDQSGSLVVYTTIDVDAIQLAMSGEDPSCIALLPQGFKIVPMLSSPITDTTNSSEPPISLNNNSGGCLLTMGVQVLASTIPSAKLNLSSVTAINNHLCNTLHQIEAALSSTNSHENGFFLCTEPTKQWKKKVVTRMINSSLPAFCFLLCVPFWILWDFVVLAFCVDRSRSARKKNYYYSLCLKRRMRY